MKLSIKNLDKFFTIANRENSDYFLNPTNTFDFNDNNKDLLVVTIGDSWTWGADIAENVYYTDWYKNQLGDNNFRLTHHYGRLVADEVGGDWLNLALGGSGNFWLTQKVKELAQIITNLEYKKIYVICTFTETGRWFNSIYDRYIDYWSYFKNLKDFDQLLVMLNQECIKQITSVLKEFDHVSLKIGTNFVDPIGFEILDDNQILSVPWYQIMNCFDGISTSVCAGGVNGLQNCFEFIPTNNHGIFKEWLISVMKKSNTRLDTLTDPTKFRYGHPLSNGHKVWAEYILKEYD
jgi:hypothetical protein